MSSWRSVPRTRFGWLLFFGLILFGLGRGGLGWGVTPAAAAPPRPRPRTARPERPPPPAPKIIVRDCEVWPPKSFPRISDLYGLKLEYDCRNRAIAHKRYGLASQEARQSTALAEKRDRSGIDEKNRWAEKEQSDIDSRQRELDEWRDEVVKKLQAVEQELSAERTPAEPGAVGAAQ